MVGSPRPERERPAFGSADRCAVKLCVTRRREIRNRGQASVWRRGRESIFAPDGKAELFRTLSGKAASRTVYAPVLFFYGRELAVQPSRFTRRFDAELITQQPNETLIMLLHGRGFALSGEDFHCETVH